MSGFIEGDGGLKPNQYALLKWLPHKFIFELGIYLQTCSHIELFASALATSLEIENPNSEAWILRYAEIRKKGTEELIKTLQKSSKFERATDISGPLQKLCDWMLFHKSNRHIAVHGAFFGRPDGTLRVDYIQRSGSRKDPVYARTEGEVTAGLVAEALDDANDILLTLTGMIASLDGELLGQIFVAIMPHALDQQSGGWHAPTAEKSAAPD